MSEERIGPEIERPQYFGPVKLVSYEVREKHGHIYMVDDPGKLPERAAGVRVRLDSGLQAFLFDSYRNGRRIDVAPSHRYWWEGGKLLWTISSAKASRAVELQPQEEDAVSEDSKRSVRASMVYCNDVKKVALPSGAVKWRYFRDASLEMDDPKGACGTDRRLLKWEQDDHLEALGHCSNGKEKFKISW